MTTVIERKTPVEAKWSPKQIQEAAVQTLARHFMASFAVLCKQGPEAIKEFDKHMIAGKVEHYKKLGVKTPIDLVKAISEFEANVFGSKIQIQGDEHKASLTYESCAMWNAMKEMGKMTAQQEEQMGSNFQNCMQNLAQEFGFKSEVKFEEPTAIITFSK